MNTRFSLVLASFLAGTASAPQALSAQRLPQCALPARLPQCALPVASDTSKEVPKTQEKNCPCSCGCAKTGKCTCKDCPCTCGCGDGKPCTCKKPKPPKKKSARRKAAASKELCHRSSQPSSQQCLSRGFDVWNLPMPGLVGSARGGRMGFRGGFGGGCGPGG